MNTTVTIKLADTEAELNQVLALQDANHKDNLSAENRKENGFVTVRHSQELLKKMNAAAGQVIAKDGAGVVGYALVMLKEISPLIPVLMPMFEMFNTLSYNGRVLSSYKYYVMGQICVAESHRGQGVFQQLYDGHRKFYSNQFELCLTEVSSSNTRSMRAHEKVGFRTIHSFEDNTDRWNILAWDWS
jgi:ribosomal protein S18 acetylase RimI-like enzyme